MNTVKVGLIYYDEEGVIELEFDTRSEEFEVFLEKCLDLKNYIVKEIIIDDVSILFLGNSSRVTEFVGIIEKLECLTDNEICYLGAYDEEFGITDLEDFKGLIEYDLFNYTFYARRTLDEVADELVEEYDIPYFISQHIDMNSFYDSLIDDGYVETAYGVIVR